MFCPECGANLPDDAAFCTSCGNRLQAQQTQQTQPEMNLQAQSYQSVGQPTMAQSSAKSRSLSKKDFLANEASETVRKSAKNSTFAFLAAVVLVIVSAIVAMNTAFYKLPIISTVLTINDEDAIDEIEDDLKTLDSDDFDDARDVLEEFEDELDKSDYKKIKRFINQAEDMTDNPSISNISSAINQLKKLAKIDVDRDLEDRLDFGSVDSIQDVVDVLNGVKTAIYIITAVIILLVVLAFVKKSVGLTVFAAIFSAPFVLSLAGFIWYVLILASLIAMAVMFSKINKEYNA